MRRDSTTTAPPDPLPTLLGASGVLGACLLACAVSAAPATAASAATDDALDAARVTIVEDDVFRHLSVLASPELEGRDSPSAGLERAAAYLADELASYGYRGVGDGGAFELGFTRALPVPDAARCEVTLLGAESDSDSEEEAPRLHHDFVPLPGCTGEATGAAVFVGFGIDRKGYDDLGRKDLDGAIAVVLEGEPRHRRLFDGPDVVTDAADVYDKVRTLVAAGVAGVLVVRRPPPEASSGPDGEPLAVPVLGYRYTWADWNPATTEQGPRLRQSWRTPVLEITPALARRILGTDVLALAEKGDASGKPVRLRDEGARLRIAAGLENARVRIDNVAGLLEGSDPDLAREVLVLGAHYDHIGVDPRGRVGFGADDNASGTSAMLEVAEALAASRPRRSVLVAFFAAEEDGLLGSAAFVDALPVEREGIVAMLNMDMVGRGEADQVVVLGTDENPDLAEVLEAAAKERKTGVRDVVTDRAQHLWQRSDHYSFHRAGIPVLFFFEAVSEDLNPDYHTFRDTVASVDVEKVANTARLCLQVAWALANADGRPGAPRR